jgi:hypothetical protein
MVQADSDDALLANQVESPDNGKVPLAIELGKCIHSQCFLFNMYLHYLDGKAIGYVVVDVDYDTAQLNDDFHLSIFTTDGGKHNQPKRRI